jgi:hypothetical protein
MTDATTSKKDKGINRSLTVFSMRYVMVPAFQFQHPTCISSYNNLSDLPFQSTRGHLDSSCINLHISLRTMPHTDRVQALAAADYTRLAAP